MDCHVVLRTPRNDEDALLPIGELCARRRGTSFAMTKGPSTPSTSSGTRHCEQQAFRHCKEQAFRHCEPAGRGNPQYDRMLKHGLLRRYAPRNDDVALWSLRLSKGHIIRQTVNIEGLMQIVPVLACSRHPSFPSTLPAYPTLQCHPCQLQKCDLHSEL